MRWLLNVDIVSSRFFLVPENAIFIFQKMLITVFLFVPSYIWLDHILDLDATKLCNMSAIKEINLEGNPVPPPPPPPPPSDTYSELLQLSQQLDIKLLISEPPALDHMD